MWMSWHLDPCFLLFSSALSVIFLCYKRKNKCVKCAHIVYQPILAKIYLLAAYSALAQEYHVCYMHVGQHIFCFTLCIPADIYAGVLLAIQPTYIIPHIVYWPGYI